MPGSPKPRPPRLRASCDGCFLAKVKCSKARPMCSRCLACGLECRYSPSSRAGKPKLDGSNKRPRNSTGVSTTQPDSQNHQPFVPSPIPSYKLESGWSTPLALDAATPRNPSVSSTMSALGMTGTCGTDQPGCYTFGIPWTPTEIPGRAYGDMPMAAAGMSGHHSRSSSMDAVFPAQMTPWADTAAQENMYFSSPSSIPTPPGATSAYITSPSLSRNSPLDVEPRPMDVGIGGSNGSGSGSSCSCFSACLQSLQALHSASSPHPVAFDTALSLSRTAVKDCAAMLACASCISGSGNPTTAMLLATVIGKITSFYRNASKSHFERSATGTGTGTGGSGSGNNGAGLSGSTSSGEARGPKAGPSVSLGVYTIAGEERRSIELQILAGQLDKLREVYSQFCAVCVELTDDLEVSRAMIEYLGQSLGSTLEDLSHRKGSIGII